MHRVVGVLCSPVTTPNQLQYMKSNLLFTLAVTALGTLTMDAARAHHGRDFILVEDPNLPAPGSLQVFANSEWERTGSGNEYGVEPGVLFGLLPHLSLGLETSFRDESDGWNFNTVTPKVHVLLTPASAKLPFRAALSFGYQFAQGAGEEMEEEAEAGEEHGSEHHHEFSGIHNHDSDLLSVKLAVETRLTDKLTLAGNLISVLPDGQSAKWGYAVGLRRAMGAGFSVGLETLGDFDSEGWHELGGGAYYEPTCKMVFKLGVSFGLTETTPDFLVRAGMVYRF